MPTFANLELLSDVRAKINAVITTVDDNTAVETHEGLADPHPQYALETDFVETAQDAIGGMVDTSLVYADAGPTLSRAALTGAVTATAGSNATSLGSFTKAQLDGAVSDGNVLYVGDAPTSHSHAQSDVTGLVTDLSNKQPLDADLTTIAGLTATTDNFIQSKAGAWASRTVAQVKTDLGLTGTNSGDQTSIVGITGTKAQFDTAVSDGNIVFVGSETPTDLTYTAATRVLASSTGTDATLPLMSSGDAGLVPASGGGTSNFLRADGTFAAPPGGGSGLTQSQVLARMSMGF